MCDLCYVLCGYVCMCLCSTCMSAMYVVCLCVICVCALCCVCIYTMYCVVCGGWMCVSLSCLARSSMRWEITKGYFTKQMGFPNLFLALWHLHLSLFSSDHKGLCVILVRSGLPGWEAEKVLPGAEQWGFGTHKGGGVVPSLWSEFWDPRPWSDENHLKRACEVIAPPPTRPHPLFVAVVREGVSVVLANIKKEMGGLVMKKELSGCLWISFGYILNPRLPPSVYLTVSFINGFDFFKWSAGPKGTTYCKEIRRRGSWGNGCLSFNLRSKPFQGRHPHPGFQPGKWLCHKCHRFLWVRNKDYKVQSFETFTKSHWYL